MYDVITVTENSELKPFLSVQRKVFGPRTSSIPMPDFEVRRLLNERLNPALQRRKLLLLLVRRQGEPIGRCSLVLPGSNGERTAVFGFFECVDDQHAAILLLRRAEELCAENGAVVLHGPFSPTTSGVTGVQLNCFDEPNVLYEACSPPYYVKHFEAAGYEVEGRGRTWRNTTLRADMEVLSARLPDRPSRYHTRQMDLRELQGGIRDLASIFDVAFSDNWSREAMTLDEYFYVAQYLIPAWRPESLTIVYDGSKAVGALLNVPDINPVFRDTRRKPRAFTMGTARKYARHSRTLITFAMGMLPEYQNSAAGLLLARAMVSIAQNYEQIYSTWITEGNSGSERMAARFGLEPWRTFAVYRKEIQ